ncbi:MAG: Glycosyl transferase family 2 [Candidatus Wolfebacteria bacterium GW2011_GWE1_48_7]|nr:MAG: Glycosyl transferase family 2 [Candidatus Wolfebacteria bacterium GW2011_GWC1_47_103]KKU59896.1 MAG: Glycosyl transferase family 2 [Candidatus Wolfebacteria bacterium GW2011_GWE2_47_12]KKW00647.1 MAG: Glycosyl transferase family 2 [Candidatus Wolfebacteria bacterium GW2011_GWE1_48_7]
MDTIMISVIIATKNGERFIERVIRSVLRQEGVDFEVVVVDDASTDGTANIVHAIASRDARVRYFYRAKNEGPGRARNFAVAQAKGGYVAVIDDDDEWPDTNKLREQVGFLEAHPEYVLVGSGCVRVVDELENILFEQRYPKNDEQIRASILGRNCFAHSGALYRKDVFQQLGGYKDMRLAEDYDLWLRMGAVGKFANLDTFCINWTQRAGSVSAKKKWKMNLITLGLIWNYKKQYPYVMRALVRGVARLVWYGVLGLSSPYALIKKNGFPRKP